MARGRLMLLLFFSSPAFAADGGGASGGVGALIAGLVVLVVAWKRPAGVLATALAGAGVAAYLAQHHKTAASGSGSLCNVSDTWNCDLVNSSRWAELFDVPIALYGFGLYCGLAWLAWRWLQGKEDASVLLAVGAALAVAVDAFLGLQMIQMGTGCILCITTYALNLLLLVGAALEARRHPFGATLGAAVSSHAGVAAIVGLAGYLGGLMVYRSGGEPETVSGGSKTPVSVAPADLSQFYEQAGGEVAYTPQDPVYGDPSARFTLVEWADFQCPHCQWMYGQLHELLADPANKDVKLVYRNYPISSQCNQFVGQSGHPNACGAATAGECAREQGRFWEMAGAMFKNQDYLGKDDIRFMVEQNGLDATAFEACLAKPETGALVLADIEAGGKAGVQGTPSVYLYGAFGDRWVRLKADKEQMAALLAAARAGTALPPPGPPEEPPG